MSLSIHSIFNMMSQTSYYCSLLKPACSVYILQTMRHRMLYYKMMRCTLKVLISDCCDTSDSEQQPPPLSPRKRKAEDGRRINKKIGSSAFTWMDALTVCMRAAWPSNYHTHSRVGQQLFCICAALTLHRQVRALAGVHAEIKIVCAGGRAVVWRAMITRASPTLSVETWFLLRGVRGVCCGLQGRVK